MDGWGGDEIEGVFCCGFVYFFWVLKESEGNEGNY